MLILKQMLQLQYHRTRHCHCTLCLC